VRDFNPIFREDLCVIRQDTISRVPSEVLVYGDPIEGLPAIGCGRLHQAVVHHATFVNVESSPEGVRWVGVPHLKPCFKDGIRPQHRRVYAASDL
jgi:hypothetical protein